MNQAHNHTNELWRHPLRVYAAIVAVLSVLIIVAQHIGMAWHVWWAVPVVLLVYVVAALWFRDATMLYLFLLIAIPLETVRVVAIGGASIRLFHVFMAICGVWMLWRVVRCGIGPSWQELRRRWAMPDTAVLLFLGFALTVTLWQPVEIMQVGVLVVCCALYMLSRVFVRSAVDAMRAIVLFVVGGSMVSVYAIAQNIFFHIGLPSMEVMPGRPNALLSEPDWLGAYLVIVLAMAMVQLFVFSLRRHVAWWKMGVHYGMMTVVLVALIITAARSAWLGAAAVIVLHLLALGVRGAWDVAARHIVVILGVALCAVGIVFFGALTDFHLLDRVSSTGTGQQEITVSCGDAERAEQLVHVGFVAHVDDVVRYGCRHIRLEEIAQEEADGNSVMRVKRADPNITMRKNIYETTYRAIVAQPWTGYGWGSSAALLGTDEQGTPLNTSNLFLEVAFSVGIIGAVLYLFFISTIVFSGILRWLRQSSSIAVRSSALAAILGICAIIVPNMFNAGIFLSAIWCTLGIVAVVAQRSGE